jgi:glycosyltransferase involved in cell wall biosynthesis
MNEKKRILIFSTAYLPFVGGAEIAIKEITSRLGNDFEFDLITAKLHRTLRAKGGIKKLVRQERVGNVNVYRLGIGVPLIDKFLLPFWGAIKAWKLEKRANCSHFWVVMVSYAGGAAYLLNIFRRIFGRKKIPIILTLQEGDSESHLRYRWLGLVNFSWKLALRRADILTVISSYLLERAKQNGFIGEGFLIPNGVDTKRFQAEFSETELNLLKRKLNKKEDDIFIITTSRLVKKNGVNDVISALQFLPENVKFLILGIGPLKRSLKLKARSLKLEGRIKFLGLVDPDKIPQYLHISDIFVRPSLSEGMGNSFIEAMAASIPVIATSVGGIVDFLFDPDKNSDKPPTGLFCKVRDPEDIAKQVKRLLKNPVLRAQIILNAKRLTAEKYDWSIIAKDMKEKVLSVKV